MEYTPHHTAISVRDLNQTLRFYSVFGFQQVHRYDDPDKVGVKLKLKGYVLEVFAYNKNHGKPRLALSLGNDLDVLGIKHIGVTVGDLDAALSDLKDKQLASEDTKILAKGSARFFFIQDPDGVWVEVSKDNRY